MEGMRRGRATFLCLNVSFLWGCQLVCLCVSRLPSAPLPKSPVECRDGAVRGQQGTSAGAETGGGGSNERKRIGSARGKWGGGRGKRGRRQEGRKPKKAGWHRRAGVGGVRRWFQSLGLDQLLSGGGSLCTLFFFILSRYSCWDTASTEARISSSSQSFRPKAEGDIC